jgi:hypothetical protein
MIKRFINGKLFLFFVFMIFAGFFLGYDYAVVTSKEPEAASFKAPQPIPAASTGAVESTLDRLEQDTSGN